MPGPSINAEEILIKSLSGILTQGAAPTADLFNQRSPIKLTDAADAHQRFVEGTAQTVEGGFHWGIRKAKEADLPMVVASLDLAQKVNAAQIRLRKGLSDPLRIGESMSNPTWGNLAKDFGRALVVVEGATAGSLQAFKVPIHQLVPKGGPMSCVVNGAANGARLSGQKIFANLDTMARGRGLDPKRVISPNFEGLQMRDVEWMYRQTGVAYQKLMINPKPGSTAASVLDDLLARAEGMKDPIGFGVNWKQTVPNTPGGSHFLVLTQQNGKYFFLDQFGVWAIRKGNAEVVLENLFATPQGLKGSQVPLSVIDSFRPEAFRVLSARPSITLPPPSGIFLDNPLNLEVPYEALDPGMLLMLAKGAIRDLLPAAPGAGKNGAGAKPKEPFPSGTIHPNAEIHPRPVKRISIVRGDTLIGLAKKHYRDGAQYPRITQANPQLRGFIPHNQLPEGMSVAIP